MVICFSDSYYFAMQWIYSTHNGTCVAFFFVLRNRVNVTVGCWLGRNDDGLEIKSFTSCNHVCAFLDESWCKSLLFSAASHHSLSGGVCASAATEVGPSGRVWPWMRLHGSACKFKGAAADVVGQCGWNPAWWIRTHRCPLRPKITHAAGLSHK